MECIQAVESKTKASMSDHSDDFSDEDFATQGFVPHESDTEQLWNVVAILKERGNGEMFLVQWEGADEEGNPWPNSWVPRADITNDLVEAWNRKQAEMKKEKARQASERRVKSRQRCEQLSPFGSMFLSIFCMIVLRV